MSDQPKVKIGVPDNPKFCKECGCEMVRRVNKKTQEPFWGCCEYPDCLYTEPFPEEFVMREIGHPTLPGFNE